MRRALHNVGSFRVELDAVRVCLGYVTICLGFILGLVQHPQVYPSHNNSQYSSLSLSLSFSINCTLSFVSFFLLGR